MNRPTRDNERLFGSAAIRTVAAVFAVAVACVVAAAPAHAEDDVSDLKGEEKKIQNKIEKTEKELNAAKVDLTAITRSLVGVQAKVADTKDELERIADEIAQREQALGDLEKKLAFQDAVLRATIRQMYVASRDDELFVLADGTTDGDDPLRQADHIATLRSRTAQELEQITATRDDVRRARAGLDDSKAEQQRLLAAQQSQQRALAADKAETMQEISEKQATLAQLQAKLAEVRNDLSSLLGRSIDTDDIVDAAKAAGKLTGVRKDFILGELVVETNLGKFTGGCRYDKTRMKDADKKVFKIIMKELGYKLNDKKISCSPGFGYGGAMGVAQFMPTTWAGADGKGGYKSKIASLTGHNPPDPWNLTDGVVGMALKLAAGGATSRSGEKVAAKRYYCGGPGSPYWKTKCETYAKNVLYWADNYEKLLK